MKLERICYWVTIFALGILLAKLQWCSGRKPCPTITQQVKHDTIKETDSFFTERPVPVSVKKKINPKVIINNNNTDTLYVFEECDDLKEYSQQYDFNNGTVIVENQIENNSLKNQSVTLHTNRIDSTVYVKQTDTLYREKKGRVVLYFGAGLYGNKTSAGGILKTSLKFKNDYILSAGYLQGFNNTSYWQATVDVPIKLRKR